MTDATQTHLLNPTRMTNSGLPVTLGMSPLSMSIRWDRRGTTTFPQSCCLAFGNMVGASLEFRLRDHVSHRLVSSGRWGCVMLGEYTAEILDTIDEQAKVINILFVGICRFRILTLSLYREWQRRCQNTTERCSLSGVRLTARVCSTASPAIPSKTGHGHTKRVNLTIPFSFSLNGRAKRTTHSGSRR